MLVERLELADECSGVLQAKKDVNMPFPKNNICTVSLFGEQILKTIKQHNNNFIKNIMVQKLFVIENNITIFDKPTGIT